MSLTADVQAPPKEDCLPSPSTAEPTPESCYLADIRRARATLRLAELEYETARDEAKAAKSRMEAAQRELNEVIDAGPERLPLFDGPELASDDWRSTPIEKLSLGPAINKVLHEQGLDTIGDLADWTAAEKRLIDIKGIGEAKAEQIERALEIFWEEWNDEHPGDPGKDAAS